MMAFYKTYAALVKHLQAAYPSGTELSADQHELLGSAEAYLPILEMQCDAAASVCGVAEDLDLLLADPEQIARLLAGLRPGIRVILAGAREVATFAANSASLLNGNRQ